jgi:phosphopantothenoylcysteine decarboxylase/phosphopantothenate--cysteine ligase
MAKIPRSGNHDDGIDCSANHRYAKFFSQQGFSGRIAYGLPASMKSSRSCCAAARRKKAAARSKMRVARSSGRQLKRPDAASRWDRAALACRRETPRHNVASGRAEGHKRVLLIIGGGIAAYKSPDLIRRLKERVHCGAPHSDESRRITRDAAVCAHSSATASLTDLFGLADEFDVGHIRLARETDLIAIAPATADLMAKLAGGHADDLATAVLLATTTKFVSAGDEPAHVGEQGNTA